MTGTAMLADLPPAASTALREFVSAVRAASGDALRSVVLFGSAAEGRLRATSDINVLVIADRFTAEQLDAVRLELRAGRAACGLTVMFLATGELGPAAEAFGLKFADMKVRHRLLWGEPLLEQLDVSREAAQRRLQQVLLNLQVRLRERYVIEGDHEEQLALILADAVGPVRSSAATLLWLRSAEQVAPKAALDQLMTGERWTRCLDGLSRIHRGEALAAGATRALCVEVMALLGALREMVAAC